MVSLSGCVRNIYLPEANDVSNNPQEIEKQRKDCFYEGLNVFHEENGYVQPAAGAIVGGAVGGAIGGAAGGTITGGMDEADFINNYEKSCMKEKGYKFEGRG
jgi:hypothetical protein